MSAAQHEAERESQLCHTKDQIWFTGAGVAEGGHAAGLLVSVWGHSGPSATNSWPAKFLYSTDRPAVGPLFHQHHCGGTVRSEEWTRPLCSAAWRSNQVEGLKMSCVSSVWFDMIFM